MARLAELYRTYSPRPADLRPIQRKRSIRRSPPDLPFSSQHCLLAFQRPPRVRTSMLSPSTLRSSAAKPPESDWSRFVPSAPLFSLVFSPDASRPDTARVSHRNSARSVGIVKTSSLTMLDSSARLIPTCPTSVKSSSRL